MARRYRIDFLHPIARVLIALIFVSAGFEKLRALDSGVQYMAMYGLPPSRALLTVAALVELLGGLALAFGILVRPAALLLAAYLIPVTLIFHTAFSDPTQIVNFLKNLAIIGGLLQTAVAAEQRIPMISRPGEPIVVKPVEERTREPKPPKSA